VGTGQLKVSRGLAYLGAVQHQSQMFGFDVLAAGFQAMVHRGLQTNLMTNTARCDTGFSGMF
jgi:hypothetical protein